MKNEKFKPLGDKKFMQYQIKLSSFLVSYNDQCWKYLRDDTKRNAKGLYKKAKQLWAAAYELQLPQNQSVEHVLYIDFNKEPSIFDNKDKQKYREQNKKRRREEHFDRFLVNYIQNKFEEQKNKYEEDPSHLKPTLSFAFEAFQKKLERMSKKFPNSSIRKMSKNAIKEKYKRELEKRKQFCIDNNII